MRNTFLQISDYNWSIRLHEKEYDSIDDFIDKIKLLRDEIDKFAMYLEQNK